jgi:hypothetical protein
MRKIIDRDRFEFEYGLGNIGEIIVLYMIMYIIKVIYDKFFTPGVLIKNPRNKIDLSTLFIPLGS